MTINTLKAIDISKTFIQKDSLFTRKTHTVLSNVSLTIKKGEITGLLGLNGAGKTTLIKIFSSLLTPTNGQIFIDGNNIENDIYNYRRKINIISGGENSLYQRLSILENLQYFASLYSIPKYDRNFRINSLLNRVGLLEYKEKKVESISKGMKQRLQIAKGLLNEPEYLFLDEPTIGLDVGIASDFRNLITSLIEEKNIGVLLTSHYINEIEELCNTVYLLDNGKIIKQGTLDELKKQLGVKKRALITFKASNKNEIINLIPRENNIKLIEKGANMQLTADSEKIFNILELLKRAKCYDFEIFDDSDTLEDALLKFEKDRNHANL